MAVPGEDTIVYEVPSQQADQISTEKTGISDDETSKTKGAAPESPEIKEAAPAYDNERESGHESDTDREDAIIVTGADAAAHLLPLRDDGEPALTFRSLFLASALSCFQAVVYQIYMVRGTVMRVWVPVLVCMHTLSHAC
jgi:hypothetical protein